MIKTEVHLSGPFFAGPITPKVGKHLDAALQELLEKGEARLGQILQKGGATPGIQNTAGVYLADGKSTGYYRNNVSGQLRPDHSALITDGGVCYGSWLEGTSSRNQSTRFRGYQSFKHVHDWLQEQVPAVLEKHAAKLTKDLD